MKKAILFLFVIATLTSCCFSQVPTQYVYVDEQCEAILPDYTDIVVAYDNCDVPILIQTPTPGDTLYETILVEIRAVDGVGNSRAVYFDVVTLDTIAPTIQLNPDWVGYSDKEVGDMYRTFYGWVQLHKDQFVDTFQWDTIQYTAIVFDGIEQNEQITFQNTIVFPDTVRRDWWWAN